MKQRAETVVETVHRFITDLKTCSIKRDLLLGRLLHAKANEGPEHSDKYIVNGLVHMYRKCGCMVEARGLFDNIQEPNVVLWNTLLLGYVENGEATRTLELLSRMKMQNYLPDSFTYVAAFKACTCLAAQADQTGRKRCLELGKSIHLEMPCQVNDYIQNTLIDMYSKCGSMVDARRVFNSIHRSSVVSWTNLLLGYADNGEGRVALELFSKMDCPPDSVTYVAVLRACMSLALSGDEIAKKESLEWGRRIHSEIGCHLNPYVQNTLVDMYCKCGSMQDALEVFNSIHNPSIVSWTALLLGYAENGDGHVALSLFSKMKETGCTPDAVAYVAALKACTSLAMTGDGSRNQEYLEWGKTIHSEVGCQVDRYVQSTLIEMYSKYGSMVEAREIFDCIQRPDVVCWTSLLLGYVDNGEGLEALELLSMMKAERGCIPDSAAYVAALKACGLVGALALGRKFHSEITEFTPQVVTCLVDFYAKCGSVLEAREVFDLHSNSRSVTTWTALLAGYGRFGESGIAFDLFDAMQDEGFRPDAVTFVCLLLSCSHAGLLEKARECFEAMPVYYGVTPTVTHYTCMVDGLGRANRLNEAIEMIRRMPCTDTVTWSTLLGACRKWKNVEFAREAFQVLANMDKKNASTYVLMANIYGSCGMWEEEEKVLETSLRLKALEHTQMEVSPRLER